MDLTTLTRAKAALMAGVGSLPIDGYIQGLISAASDAACQWCSRTFQRNTVTNLTLNGTGTARQMLPFNPLISITGPLIINGSSVEEAPPMTGGLGINFAAVGYAYDRKFLYALGGLVFTRGLQNLLIPSLVTGFTTTQTDTIGASPYTLTPRMGAGVDAFGAPTTTNGYAFTDCGVTFTATGIALTRVYSGTPTTGQYTFSEGVYTFAAADTTKEVAMSYDFVPGSAEQAVIEMVGTKIRQKENYGIRSRTLGNESVNYSDYAMSPSVKAMLNPFRFTISP